MNLIFVFIGIAIVLLIFARFFIKGSTKKGGRGRYFKRNQFRKD